MGHELADWLCAIDAIAAPSIADARHLRQRDGGTILEALVRLGAITDQSLTLLLRERLRLPIVAPAALTDIPASAIATIPPDMAVEYRVMPLAIDSDGNLVVAFSDPSDTAALEELSFFTGRHVMRTIAMQAQIAWCLARYFGIVTPLAEPLLISNDTTEVPPSPAAWVNQAASKPPAAEIQPLVLPKKRAPRITEEMVEAPRYPGAGRPALAAPVGGNGHLAASVPLPIREPHGTASDSVSEGAVDLAPRTGEINATRPRMRRLTDLPPVMIDLDQLAPAAPVPAEIIDHGTAAGVAEATEPPARTRARSETVVGYASPRAIAHGRTAVTKHLTRDLTAATKAIASSQTRDEAIREFLQSMYTDHIALCVIRGDAITVHPNANAYTPLTEVPSIGAAIARGRPYRGPLPDAKSQAFATAQLGQFMPLIVIVPIVLRERAVAFSLAELTSRTPDDSQLIALAQVTANTFARLAVSRRTTGDA